MAVTFLWPRFPLKEFLMTEFYCNCNRYQDCSGIALPPNPVHLTWGNGLWRFVVCRNCALPLKEITAVTRFARLSSNGPYQCTAVVLEGRAIFIDFYSLKRPRKHRFFSSPVLCSWRHLHVCKSKYGFTDGLEKQTKTNSNNGHEQEINNIVLHPAMTQGSEA